MTVPVSVLRIFSCVAFATIAVISRVAAQPTPSPPPSTPTTTASSSASDTAAYETALARRLAQPGGLTAATVAERALKASPKLRAKAAELLQAKSRASAAKLSNVPLVSVSANYTRLNDVDDPELAPGVSFEILNHSSGIIGSLTLPVTDYLFKNPRYIKASKQSLAAAEYAQTASRDEVVLDAQSTYYEWIRVTLQVVVAEQLVGQLDQTLTQLRAQAAVERLAKAEVLTFEAEKARAELGLAQVQRLAEIREAQLRIAIGAQPSEALAIGEDLGAVGAPVVDAQAKSVEALTAQAMASRSDVAGMSLAIASQKTLSKVYNADKLPKLALFGQISYDNPNQRVFPSQDKYTGGWAIGARLSWSVNDILSSLPKLDESEATISELRAQQELLAQGVTLEVLAAKKQLDLAVTSLQTAERGVVAAEEGTRVRKALFDAGRATSLELIGAQTQLTSSRADVINARIDIRIAAAQLQKALGESLATPAN